MGIETSCDDTAAAVFHDGHVLSSVVASQTDHLPYEGVVPELASRAHVKLIAPVVKKALADAGLDWDDLDGVAATHAPGLIGSLLVGLTFAKASASARGIPFVGINHLEAHLLSVLISAPEIQPPLVGLLASGGHTALARAPTWHHYEILGSTRDDAAGEAFDKTAILLGLGFPGGPAIDRRAREGDPTAITFPRAWLGDTLDFSFSGLKTAVRNHVAGLGGLPNLAPGDVNNIAASFQEAVVDVLSQKTLAAADQAGVGTVILAGGVAANRNLRNRLAEACTARGWVFATPELAYCGDNGAMVAVAGSMRLALGEQSPWSLAAVPTLTQTSFGSTSTPG